MVQVDILIVVCSCFAPTPSLASMIVNHFKMRTDVLSHNLAGMGCSGGVVALDMAKQFLQVRLRMERCSSECCAQCAWIVQHLLQCCQAVLAGGGQVADA